MNAKKFVSDFKTLHDQSHDSVASVAEICLGLFNWEYKFLGGNYSTDLNDARCKLKDYFDSTVNSSADISTYLNSVNADSDTLLQIAGEFMKNNDLTCRPSFFLKGCEAELNALKCELATFLKELKPKRDNAVAFIKGIKVDLTGLSKLAERFQSSTNLTCGGCGSGDSDKGVYCKLRIAANEFFVAYNKLHWSSHIKFVNLQFICDDITTKVSTLNVKYNCF